MRELKIGVIFQVDWYQGLSGWVAGLIADFASTVLQTLFIIDTEWVHPRIISWFDLKDAMIATNNKS